MALQSVTEEHAAALERFCDVVVPGSGRVGPSIYIDALLSRMPAGAREGFVASIEQLGEIARGGAPALAPHAATPGFLGLRALACEAFYSDFVAPGRDVAGAWDEIDFHPRAAAFLQKDWSYLGIDG